jgi:hypothetical protein
VSDWRPARLPYAKSALWLIRPSALGMQGNNA